MRIEQVLQKFGLGGKEVRVYLALLKLGSARVTQISKESGYQRTYCYDILNDLIKREIIVKIEPKGKVAIYQPKPPKILSEMAYKQFTDIKTILPLLKSIFDLKEYQPVVTLYKGIEGIKDIYEDLEKCKSKIAYGIINPTVAYQVGGKLLDRNIVRCARNGVEVKDLYTVGRESTRFAKQKKFTNMKVKQLPKSFRINTDFLVYDDKICQISYKKPIHGYIIESGEMANFWRQVHKALWKMSK